MAKKKTEGTAPSEDRKVIDIRPRHPTDWMALMKKVEATHWRRIQVTIRLREWLMAGKPAQLDAANAMLKARGLEDQIEAVPVDDPAARTAAAAEVVNEGLCEFHRRPGRTGIFLPTNHCKAMIKESWSVLGLRVSNRGSRGALAEGMFIYSLPVPDQDPAERNYVYLADKPDGVHTSVSHTTGPMGPVSAIKRNEYVIRPTLTFEMAFAEAIVGKLPDEDLARTWLHAAEHGLGACRSQGFGQFNIVSIVELESASTQPFVPAVVDDQAPVAAATS